MQHFAYDGQLASAPSVVEDILAGGSFPRLDPGRPIILSGIGTSLHAARVAADWVQRLTGGAVRAFAVDAHDLGSGAFPIRSTDQVVVISHRGYKTYPKAALARATELGCFTVAVVGREAPDQPASTTLRTCANETAGTFSVSYLASLAALARLVANAFPREAAEFSAALPAVAGCIERSLRFVPGERWTTGLAEHSPILISGFGSDLPTAQEAALKIKEGAWLWTEAMSPEFAIHGTPASYHSGMSALVILPDMDDGGRSRLLIDVLARLGLRHVAAVGPVGSGADLEFAPPPHPLLRPFLSILPFHLLTAELARLRGTDPDTLHGGREPWKGVMTSLTL